MTEVELDLKDRKDHDRGLIKKKKSRKQELYF